MRLAVTGGRDMHVSDEDFEWLLALHPITDTWYLLGGCNRGVDAEILARLQKIQHSPGPCMKGLNVIPADWAHHGRAAGPIRNQEMIDEADALAVFPGGRGTTDCTLRAEKKGIPIYRRVP